ncbi:MAG TPA: hypothetical protein VLA88_04395 [Candidatus Saccharimonadales bacterium]|nr:hypothetical protein [Candidatus Saccharimonadales bacterium]
MPLSFPHTLAGRYYVRVHGKTVLRSDGGFITFDCGTTLQVVEPASEGEPIRITGQFRGIGGIIIADTPDCDDFGRCDARHELGTLSVCWLGKGTPECQLTGVRFSDSSTVRVTSADGAAEITYVGMGVLGIERTDKAPDPGPVRHGGRFGQTAHQHALAGKLGAPLPVMA